MKVVVDTNVLVSGILFKGPPHQILLAWSQSLFELVLSPEIAEAYRRVARELQQQFPAVDIGEALEVVFVNAVAVDSVPLHEPVCTDPDDDKFLACAVASGARVIVSGDKHLLRVSGYGGIEVLRPRAFVEHYLEGAH